MPFSASRHHSWGGRCEFAYTASRRTLSLRMRKSCTGIHAETMRTAGVGFDCKKRGDARLSNKTQAVNRPRRGVGCSISESQGGQGGDRRRCVRPEDFESGQRHDARSLWTAGHKGPGNSHYPWLMIFSRELKGSHVEISSPGWFFVAYPFKQARKCVGADKSDGFSGLFVCHCSRNSPVGLVRNEPVAQGVPAVGGLALAAGGASKDGSDRQCCDQASGEQGAHPAIHTGTIPLSARAASTHVPGAFRVSPHYLNITSADCCGYSHAWPVHNRPATFCILNSALYI